MPYAKKLCLKVKNTKEKKKKKISVFFKFGI